MANHRNRGKKTLLSIETEKLVKKLMASNEKRNPHEATGNLEEDFVNKLHCFCHIHDGSDNSLYAAIENVIATHPFVEMDIIVDTLKLNVVRALERKLNYVAPDNLNQ